MNGTGATQTLVAAVLAAVAVAAWPPGPSWRALRRGPRRASPQPLEADVPECLDLMALALGGGSDLRRSVLEVAAVVGGTPGRELRAVAAALAWGLDKDAAWHRAPPRWAPAHRALLMAARAGVPPAGLLTEAAQDLRRDTVAGVETATARLGVLLVLPLGLAFLPAFLLTTVVPVVLALATDLVSVP